VGKIRSVGVRNLFVSDLPIASDRYSRSVQQRVPLVERAEVGLGTASMNQVKVRL
jgi:hypothetical protein